GLMPHEPAACRAVERGRSRRGRELLRPGERRNQQQRKRCLACYYPHTLYLLRRRNLFASLASLAKPDRDRLVGIRNFWSVLGAAVQLADGEFAHRRGNFAGAVGVA